MGYASLGHALAAVVLLAVPATTTAAQPAGSPDGSGSGWIPFELGTKPPAQDALAGPGKDHATRKGLELEEAKPGAKPPAPAAGSGDAASQISGALSSPVVRSLTASGIPDVAMQAYSRAEATTARDNPGCGLQWSLLAAIGRVESNHGRYGGAELRADGSGTKPIRGIPLDGRPGVARILDTDGGALDGDPVYDRAVGPMQFIPSTWRSVAVDGNGDGHKDPNNIFDAALGAAVYLCGGGNDLRQSAQRAQAVFRYNRSREYVDVVLSLADAYENGQGDTLPATRPPAAQPDVAAPATNTPPGAAEASRQDQRTRRPSPQPAPAPEHHASTVNPPAPRTPAPTTTSTTTTTTTAPTTTTTTTTSSTTTTTAPTTTTTVVPPVEPPCPEPADDALTPETEPPAPECCLTMEPEGESEDEVSTSTTALPLEDPPPPECCVTAPGIPDTQPGQSDPPTPNAPEDVPPDCPEHPDDKGDHPPEAMPAAGILPSEGTVPDRERRSGERRGHPREASH